MQQIYMSMIALCVGWRINETVVSSWWHFVMTEDVSCTTQKKSFIKTKYTTLHRLALQSIVIINKLFIYLQHCLIPRFNLNTLFTD